jgi:hypothetical protein
MIASFISRIIYYGLADMKRLLSETDIWIRRRRQGPGFRSGTDKRNN